MIPTRKSNKLVTMHVTPEFRTALKHYTINNDFRTMTDALNDLATGIKNKKKNETSIFGKF